MKGKDIELLTPMRGCLRGLTLAAVFTAGGELMAVFFLHVTVVKPSGSGSAVGLGGEIPAAATSLYDNSAKVVPAGIGSAGKA
jgi:hypothetical protein